MSALARWMLQARSRSILIIGTTGLMSLLILPFVLISGAAVTLVALRNSWTEIMTVLLFAAALCALFLGLVLGRPDIALQLLLFWTLAALAATVLRKSSNLALAMQVPAVTGLAVVGFIYVAVADPIELWRQVLVQSGEILGLDADSADFAQLVADRARLMTGMVAAAVLVVMNLCLFLGRWWQANLYNPGGFGHEFRNLRFGRMISLIIVVLYGLFLWGDSELVLSILCVLSALYAFQGLALVHSYARAKTLSVLALTGFYMVLFLSVYAKLFLSLLGMADAWVDGRKRWLSGASSV